MSKLTSIFIVGALAISACLAIVQSRLGAIPDDARGQGHAGHVD